MPLPIRLLDWKSSAQTAKLSELNSQTVAEIQTALQRLGYQVGKVDGIVGPVTRAAFAQFKKDRYLSDPELFGASSAASLLIDKGVVSEQPKGLNKKPYANGILGTPTGPSARIPGKSTLVYANQYVDGSKYFTWGELLHQMTRIPIDSVHTRNLIDLAKRLDWIRDKWGSSIAVTSGYRPEPINTKVGGVRNSLHTFGRAADIYPAQGNIYDLLKVVQDSDMTGIGLGMSRGFIHCDTRSGSRVVFPY